MGVGGTHLEKLQSEFHDNLPSWKQLQVPPVAEKAAPFPWVRIWKFQQHSPCSDS